MKLSHAIVIALVFAALPALSHAQDAGTLLRATRVRQRVRLEVVDGKTVKVAIDGGTEFNDLSDGRVFLASGPVVVTLRAFNPLSTEIVIAVDDAPDPTHAAVGQLVEALTGLQTVLGGTVPAAIERLALVPEPAVGCSAVDDAWDLMNDIDRVLNDEAWSADNIKRQATRWSSAIDDAYSESANVPGYKAVKAATALMDELIGQAPSPGTLPGGKGLAAKLAEAETTIRKIDKALAKDNPTACDRTAFPIYRLFRSLNFLDRLQTLKQIFGSLVDLRDALQTKYGNPKKWSLQDPTEFVARDSLEATSDTMKKVTVSVSSIQYVPAGASPGPLTVKKSEGVTKKFTIKDYSPWVPEIGVGTTFAYVKRPKYGTSTNAAGKTVVSEPTSDTHTIDPTVMLNMLCRCGPSEITPMFQVGASTSKESPAIFVGGGLRLLSVGKGDVAFGVGFILPWVKDLTSLHPGDEIKGSKDLDDDLKFRRLNGKFTYWNLQYKFHF